MTIKTYLILPGGSFALPDGTVKGAGDTIDLPSDVAASHAGMLQEQPEADPANTVTDTAAAA